MVKGNNITKVGYIIFILIAVTISLLFSCELFLVPQHGREKPGDEEAQITGFRALQYSSGTVTAEFAWKPPRDYYNDYERVKEVRLFMNKNTPYIFPVHFFDGNTLEGESLSFQTGQYAYSVEWPDLKVGEERWVTLYSRTEDGWRAPIYDRIKIVEPVPSPLIYGTSVIEDSVFVIRYDLGDAEQNPDTNYYIAGNASPFGDQRIAIIVFNELRSLDHVQGADFNLDVVSSSGTDTSGNIAPLFVLRDDGQDIREKIDMASAQPINFATGIPLDISDIIKKAVLYDTYSLVLYPNDTSDLEVEINIDDTIVTNQERLENVTYYPDN